MLGLLRALFKALVDIALLRRGPEEVPASPFLLALVIAIYAAPALYVGARFGGSPLRSAAELAFSISFTLLFYRTALNYAKKPERFTQTLTAFFGISALFAPVILPLVATLAGHAKAQTSPPAILLLAILGLGIWSIVISVHILRKAFEWHPGKAFGLLVAQNILVLLIYAMIFGSATPAP